MKIHYTLGRDIGLPPLVVAIGFFDGMHRGHREIAKAAMRMRRPGWHAAALTFSNHPASFLRPGTEPPLICTPDERINLLQKAGFDECYFIEFDETIASTRASEFAIDILLNRLRVQGVVVGSTFRFGNKRQGDVALLERLLGDVGVPAVAVDNVGDAETRISSTRIRGLIAEGKCAEADSLLGHSYEIRGRVVLGAGRGHDLGFPTANIEVPQKLLPADGVYACVARQDGRDYAALVSIGTNPTFGGRHRTVEAWLRDFHGSIYGEELRLRDLRYVREQRKYHSIEALLEQMHADTDAVSYPSYG